MERTQKEKGIKQLAYSLYLMARPERFERPTPWFVAKHSYVLPKYTKLNKP